MRVLFDGEIFCRQKFGGISRYFYELASRVGAEDGFSSVVLAPIFVNDYLLRRGADVKGLHVPKFQNSGRLISAANSLAMPILTKFEKPDVLHETYYCRRSLAPKGCPVVVTVHDMTYEKFPDSFLEASHLSGLKRKAVMRADRVICVSKNTQQDLVDIFGIPIEKTIVVHHGFTLGCSEKSQCLNRKRPFLLYVGARSGYKNFDSLLRVFASSSVLRDDFDLLAFGGGAFSAKENEQIKKLSLQGNVEQLSGNDALLANLYQQATLLIYPSFYEGFGIPLLEAMGFECPVVCSNASSIPEVVGDAAYLFDPVDVDAMGAALEAVVNSPGLRSDLVSRGKKRIDLFSWQRTASETMDVYREL